MKLKWYLIFKCCRSQLINLSFQLKETIESFVSLYSHLRCRSRHLDCSLLVYTRKRSWLFMLCHLYQGVLIWLADLAPHSSDEYWFPKIFPKQRACNVVQIRSGFTLCKRCIRASLPLPITASTQSSSPTQLFDRINSIFPDRLQHSLGYFCKGFIFSYSSITLFLCIR